MSTDDFVKIVDSLTKLLSALAWPVLVAFVLIRFGPALKEFFQSLGEFSLKGAGFEASAKRKQAEAAAALAAAAVAKSGPADAVTNEAHAKAAVDLVQEEVTPRVLRRAARASILWVDDRPENNAYTRQSLEALGVTVELARSTEEALKKAQSGSYSVIISDMGRPPDPRAGYTLLEALRKSGINTPYIICAAGGSDPENRAEARRRGAMASTARASELFSYVLQALQTAA